MVQQQHRVANDWTRRVNAVHLAYGDGILVCPTNAGVMQERQVTVGRVRHKLADPFFVLATQNPIEQEGTYPLPEAQQDRFMLLVLIAEQAMAVRLSYHLAANEASTAVSLATRTVS